MRHTLTCGLGYDVLISGSSFSIFSMSYSKLRLGLKGLEKVKIVRIV
jgi:hypothetical protein